MGDPYLFTSIAAVAIGGASILGGSGHYIGTIAGALVLTILTGLLPALEPLQRRAAHRLWRGHPDHRVAGQRGVRRPRRHDPRRRVRRRPNQSAESEM